ncbi:MAG TPA: DUF4258 domain-containing protein [Thermodesulfobacteriota bacterium]|nr:DUF4258 domain-containing protein [Thermodesulfobacteriota bacterium]
MDIEKIKERIISNRYEISFHAEKERYAENIMLSEIEHALLNGKILEDYPDDPRGASCLILGYSKKRPLHIVCGYTTTKWVRILTVYIPKPPKWVNEKIRAKRR